MDAVSLDNLSFTYAGEIEPALSDITICLRQGETLALLGADGSGKSTLLYLLAGLMVRFYPGVLNGTCHVWNGCCQSRQPKGVGILLEDPCTQFSGIAFTVFDEVALALEGRMDPAALKKRVWETLDQMGVAPLAWRNPFTLSGGEAKRVALASIIVGNPRLLLLDEPFSQLDPVAQGEVGHVLATLKNNGLTLVLTGSDVGEVTTLADRTAVICRGHLVFDGLPKSLVQNTDPEAWGISLPLVTRVAAKARTAGCYKGPLPLTLDSSDLGWCL